MSKLRRNTSDEESRRFWEGVDKGAAESEGAPSWMKAGINLNERHFHTYALGNAASAEEDAARDDLDHRL